MHHGLFGPKKAKLIKQIKMRFFCVSYLIGNWAMRSDKSNRDPPERKEEEHEDDADEDASSTKSDEDVDPFDVVVDVVS